MKTIQPIESNIGSEIDSHFLLSQSARRSFVHDSLRFFFTNSRFGRHNEQQPHSTPRIRWSMAILFFPCRGLSIRRSAFVTATTQKIAWSQEDAKTEDSRPRWPSLYYAAVKPVRSFIPIGRPMPIKTQNSPLIGRLAWCREKDTKILQMRTLVYLSCTFQRTTLTFLIFQRLSYRSYDLNL